MKNNAYNSYVNETVVRAIGENAKQLIETMNCFDQHNFNTVPFAGSWTAGQVYEHLFMSESELANLLLQGATKPANRQPDEQVGMLKNMFLVFSARFKASAAITPDDEPKDISTLFAELKGIRNKIAQAAEHLDLSLLCIDNEFPGFGYLTRLEWLYFIIYHTQKHIHQLNNIHKSYKYGYSTLVK